MSLARLLTGIATRVAPGNAREWAQALEAELAYVPPGEAASFAAGGLVMALRLRLSHPAFVHGAAQYGLAAASLGWAALHLRLALRLDGGEPSLPPPLIFAPGLMFVLAGLVTAAVGLRRAMVVGGAALAVVAVYAAAAGLLPAASPHRGLYQAVALEDAVVLVVAMLLAAAARRYGAEPHG